MLQRCTRVLTGLLNVEHCSLFLYDEDSQEVLIHGGFESAVGEHEPNRMEKVLDEDEFEQRVAAYKSRAGRRTSLTGRGTVLTRISARSAGAIGYVAARKETLVVPATEFDLRF